MATKKSSPKKMAGGAAKDWRVRVRMYRKWLGDCFLLTFRQNGDEQHVLIDCGVFQGTPAGKETIRTVIQDILETTDKHLRALVVTHEHADHVSGFRDAPDLFDQFTVDAVWAAWTEDPHQKIAQEKKKQRFNELTAIQGGLELWNRSDDPEHQQMGASVASLLGFSEAIDAAMKKALSLGDVTYLNPGDMLKKNSLTGVKVYVLGPPRDRDALTDMDGDGDSDLYSLSNAAIRMANLTNSFSAAAARELSGAATDDFRPFDQYLQWDQESWQQKFANLWTSYDSAPERRIDKDWLNSIAQLALQLDDYTNNTSLVLAFELEDTQDVLLFVGDAQIGNWLSWAKVKFEDKTTTVDLLSRTVFYKVGHHGSHNATLKPAGLEAMNSSRLVAAIPVDEEFAHRPKGKDSDGWEMPAGPLLKRLMEKTRGRVLRGDSDFPLGASQPKELNAKEWAAFSKSVNVEEHYIEYLM